MEQIMGRLVNFVIFFSILQVTPVYAGWFSSLNRMADDVRAGTFSRLQFTDANFLTSLKANRAWNDIVSGGKQDLLYYFNNQSG